MNKVAIVILADTSEADGLGRALNGLMAAKEFVDAKDEVQVIFSGAGTKWISEITNPKHKMYDLYKSLKGNITGACGFCASAFGVTESAKDSGISILEEYGTNMSFRKLLEKGYQVITF